MEWTTLLDKYVQGGIEAVKKYAPAVWEMAYRATIANTILSLALGLAALCAGRWLLVRARATFKVAAAAGSLDRDLMHFAGAVTALASLGFLCYAFYALASGIVSLLQLDWLTLCRVRGLL